MGKRKIALPLRDTTGKSLKEGDREIEGAQVAQIKCQNTFTTTTYTDENLLLCRMKMLSLLSFS